MILVFFKQDSVSVTKFMFVRFQIGIPALFPLDDF